MDNMISNIKQHLKLVQKRKGTFVLSAIVIVSIVLVASYAMPKVYEVESTVLIEANVIKSLIKDIAVTPSMDERLRVISHTMTSRSLLLKVVEDLGLDPKSMDSDEVESLVARLQKDTRVDSTEKMDLFTVSFRHTDAEFATNYVNSLVGMYIEENISAKREEAYGANRFLSEQIAFFKEKLDSSERKIIDFRKEKGIIASINESDMVAEFKQNQQKLQDLDGEEKELRARRKSIQKIKGEDPYTMAALTSKLNELLTKYTENHPEVLRVRAEMESLKAQSVARAPKKATGETDAETEMSTLNPIYQQFREEEAMTGLELAAIEAKKNHYHGLMESKEAYLREMPDEKKKLMDLEREKNTYKTIYEELVEKLGRSEVSKQMELQDKASTFMIVDPAILPTAPVSPNRMRLLLFGIAAGLAGGLGIVLLIERMDDSVKSLETLKGMDISVIAVIPRIETREETTRQRRKDAFVYGAASIYGLFILAVMAFEMMSAYF